jgi:hypothetical protein
MNSFLRVIPSGAPARQTLARLGIHTALLAAFVTAGGSLVVWPQWLLRDSSQAELAVQLSQEREMAERLEALTVQAAQFDAANELRPELWRKTVRAADLPKFPSEVSALARLDGVKVMSASVTPEITPRWRSLTVRAAHLGTPQQGAGSIRPMVATVILTGSFEGVYRTVARLCGRRQFFIPDRWNFVPRAGATAASGEYKAEIAATMFVADYLADQPVASTKPGVLALRGPSPLEKTE